MLHNTGSAFAWFNADFYQSLAWEPKCLFAFGHERQTMTKALETVESDISAPNDSSGDLQRTTT